MRLFTVVACFAGSGLAPFFALFALKSALRVGPWALAVLGLWFLALVALAVVSLAWVFGARLGKTAAISACCFGILGLLTFPVCAAALGRENWLSEFSGTLGMLILATLPTILLATRVAYFHAAVAQH